MPSLKVFLIAPPTGGVPKLFLHAFGIFADIGGVGVFGDAVLAGDDQRRRLHNAVPLDKLGVFLRVDRSVSDSRFRQHPLGDGAVRAGFGREQQRFAAGGRSRRAFCLGGTRMAWPLMSALTALSMSYRLRSLNSARLPTFQFCTGR